MSRKRNSPSIIKLVVLLVLIVGLMLPAGVFALEVKKNTAQNSLAVLQVERHNLPVVMVTLLIKASPLDEPPGKAGVAYLTSKLLTEGTARRSAAEISEEIEFLGASLEATTTADFTTISLSVLKKDVEKGFDLFADILLNPAFKEEELVRKKELIKGALRQREEDPSFVAGRAFIREVFGAHPYGRLVEGSIESVEGIRRNDVTAFYQRHYLPGNAILSIVGDLTPQELDSLMKKYLSGWQGKSAAENFTATPSEGRYPRYQGIKTVIINKNVTQANIVFGNVGMSRENPDYYAASVMNYILGGGGFASRLMRVVRDERGLTYGINSVFIPNKEPGQFEVGVQTKNESAGVVIEEILKQIRRIQTEPVTDQELVDAKAYLTGSFPRRLETSRKIADFLTAVQFYRLGDDYVEKYPGYINSVTKDDVLRVAKKYLTPENSVLVIVGNKDLLRLPQLQSP
ncbi:MAG: insulinase family protein [Alphaproteobacteria bacterium]|uniref:Insulinase family protein n=1 Tax=Candidatus Nitrobium versatile TaxID=2884831 RepID=A0A953M3K3_9BACT|nr:insulinase family protein [Candidatus Nitrobium versatile]